MTKNYWTRAAWILAAMAMVGTVLFTPPSDASITAPAADFERFGPPQDWFVRYDGIEGEALDADHKGWIDLLAVDWGVRRADGADGKATDGRSSFRRRAAAPTADDLVLTFEYERVAPKLLEAAFTGKVIPELVVEMEALGAGDGGTTYLRYELKNVLITSYDVGGSAADGRPLVTTGQNFEEVKVTYIERDERGVEVGTVETSYNAGSGQR